jgi:hypothetical protein
MADNNKTEQAEVVLGPMQLDAAAFKAALKKAKENPVDCGIFAYIEQQKKDKK